MKRSLVLAGGGMRVAWQTGVVKALEEEGVQFHHVDGTSGGILTAAMMLSGLEADEMVRRWSALSLRDFASALPLAAYLEGPWDWAATADTDGVRDKVFPALGISTEKIRAAAVEGTFNVADFVTKQSVAFDATSVDPDLLAAGMSLPIFMTPLHRNGAVYTDAVWIRDANVSEALLRGAHEVWLVWCIGNTGRWGKGPLEQYVHMIEMSATGALAADFAVARAAGRRFVLHVIKPQHPLPLDPQYFLGRISTDSLLAMGYRDARRYLDTMEAGGVPADAECTRMTEAAPSVRFTEELSGDVSIDPAGDVDGRHDSHPHRFTLSVTVVAPLSGDLDEAELAGFVDCPWWGARTFLSGGRVSIVGGRLEYRAQLRPGGRCLELLATRDLRNDPGWDAWDDVNDMAVRVDDPSGAGVLTGRLHLGPAGVRDLVRSLEPVNTDTIGRADVARRFARSGFRSLFPGTDAR